jgi:FkbM family methyltransferase
MRMVLGLALAASLTRYLGVGGFGGYALVFAYVAAFSGVFNDWGLSTVCLREIAQRPQERARLVASAATLQGLIALTSYLLMLLSLVFLPYPRNVVTGIAVYGLSLLLTPLDVVALLFQADLRLARLLAPSLLGVALNFALSITIIRFHGPLLALIGAALASLLAQYAWVTILSLKVLGQAIRPSTLEWSRFAREAWPIGTASLVTTAFQQAPILALSVFSLVGVGLFNAANKIPLQLLLLPLAIRATLFPLLSASWMTDRPRFRNLLTRAIGASLVISIPLTMFGLGLAQPLMEVLFGSNFAGAALPFALLIAVFPLLFPAILLGEALIAAGAQRVNLAILIGSLPILVILLVVMVPAFGASGAALAVLCSYAVIAGSAFLAIGSRLASLEPLRVASRAGLAAGLGLLALALATPAGPVPSAVIASLVSVAALAVLQPAPLHDLFAVTRRAAPRLGIRRRLRALRYRLGLEPIREVSYLGHSFRYPRDSVIGNAIAQGLEWDAVLRAVVATMLLKDQPVICEVGSNLGASLLQILAVKPRAHVVAYEPSQRFRPLLERNLALAGFSQVEVIPAFLGRSRGQILLHNNATSASAARAEYDGHEPRGTQIAEMTTLDEEFRTRGAIDFVKVDTDGFDFEVLRGAEELLTRERPLLFFELAYHLLANPDAGIRWLQSLGYRRLVCLTPTPDSRLLGITADPHEAVAWAQNSGYCDVLVCVQGSPFESRLNDFLRSLRADGEPRWMAHDAAGRPQMIAGGPTHG